MDKPKCEECGEECEEGFEYCDDCSEAMDWEGDDEEDEE